MNDEDTANAPPADSARTQQTMKRMNNLMRVSPLDHPALTKLSGRNRGNPRSKKGKFTTVGRSSATIRAEMPDCPQPSSPDSPFWIRSMLSETP